MYRKILAEIEDNGQTKNKALQTEKVLTRNSCSQTERMILCRDNNLRKLETDRSHGPCQTSAKLVLTLGNKFTETKSFSGVPTPGRPIPSDVSTPISVSEFQTWVSKQQDGQVNEKGQQFPSPYLGPNAMSLAKQLILESERAEKRKRRRERRMKRRKKRRKVITRYPLIHIPSFPIPHPDDLTRRFTLTDEARMASSDPKKAFVHWTNMIVNAQKCSIIKAYSYNGSFGFISEGCIATLDLFREKMIAKSNDKAIANFASCSRKLPRELELLNSLKCINERFAKVSVENRKMKELKVMVEEGSIKEAIFQRVYPLPVVELEEAKLVKEELVRTENLLVNRNKLSDIVLGNLTVKVTERWLRFKELAEDQQEQFKMHEVYNNEIANAVVPTVESILEILGAISLL